MSAPYRVRALALLRERRERADAAAQKNYSNALASSPEISRLAAEISSLSLAAVRAAFSDPSAVARIRAESEKKRKEFDRALAGTGYSRADFVAARDCPACSDTGFCGGKPCSCLTALESRLAQGELAATAPLALSKFEDFDLTLYPPESRKKMSGIYDYCVGYARDFSPRSGGILMFGPTGLGKTHLSLAIAGEVLKKGFGVIYGSAGQLFSKIEREHFSNGGTKNIDAVMNCELLVLDDLGTEFASAFNNSTVYSVINGRLLEGKPTVISTNLGLEELTSRYTDRIVSRIAGSCELLRFEGRDIRILRRSRTAE